MADRSVYIEIVLDDKGAVAKLNQLDGGLRKAGDGAKKAEKDMSGLEAMMVRASTVGTFLGNALYNLAERAIGTLVGEIGRAITLSSQATAAFMGLASVAAHFGANVEEAKSAAARLSSDGLMKVSEAALGLKNLLASGFSLPQAVRLMEAFKDSAAFGRQASLDFGYAVVSATEGIKNQNSILVDNAGVTKNLSVILKEAGFSVDALSRVSTDAKVRMALFNGILKETSAQTGDAKRLTETYSGAVSKLKTQYEFALSVIGSAITENKTVATVIGFVSDQISRLNSGLTQNGKAFSIVSEIVIMAVKTFQFLLTVIDYVQRAFYYTKAAVFAVVQAFVNLNGVFTQVMLGILQAIAKVPGATKVFHDLDDKIAFLRDTVNSNRGAFDQLTNEINDNMNAADENSAAVANFNGTLTALVTQLETTKGQTVQLGQAHDQLAAKIDNVTQKTKEELKAEKELAKFRKERDEQISEAYRGMAGAAAQEQPFFGTGQLPPWMRGGDIGMAPANPYYTYDHLTSGMLYRNGRMVPGGGQDLPDALRMENMLGPLAPPTGFNFSKFIEKNLGDTVMSALTGGGSLSKSVGGLFGQGLAGQLSSKFGGAISGMFGKDGIGGMLGNTIGGMIPGLGALAGPLLGKLTGWVGGLFGGGEGAKTNDARDDFMKKFGEQTLGKGATKGQAEAELNRLAIQAGVTDEELRKLYSTKKVEDFQKRAEEVTKKIEAQEAVLKKYGVTWTDFKGPELTRRLGDEVKKLTGEYDALIRAGLDHETAVKKVGPAYVDLAIAAVKAGQEIPAALAPTILELAKMGQLTEAQSKALLGLAADSGPSFQQMEQAAQKYGIALDDLGARYHQLKVNDMAEQLAADFKLLTEGGAPVREVLAGMADEVNKMVQEAIKYGAKIPESMRPVLEKMIEQGQLTDANGNKFTDLSKIDFATPIKSSTELLIEKMTELIDKISGVAGELRDIPSNVDTTVTVRRRYVDEDRGDDRYHTGGFVRRAHTGLAIDEVPIIAQTGEGIISREGMRRLGRSGLHSLNHGGGAIGGGDVAAALARLAEAIENRPVEVSIDGEAVAAATTKAVRRRVGPARKF